MSVQDAENDGEGKKKSATGNGLVNDFFAKGFVCCKAGEGLSLANRPFYEARPKSPGGNKLNCEEVKTLKASTVEIESHLWECL